MGTNKKPGNWRARTQGVRGGLARTPFQETAEALFLTSVSPTVGAQAGVLARTTAINQRFSNPTVRCSGRMALEGAPVARRKRHGGGERSRFPA
jgi:O-succinylhomoserine sulfhydrylase